MIESALATPDTTISKAGTRTQSVSASTKAPFFDHEKNITVSPIALHGTSTKRQRRVKPKTIRLRDREHCKFVTTQPCLVCGRTPTEAHHLRFAQPRALGRKVSDEYTVPLCRLHHRELHRYGDEASWWTAVSIDPLPVALELWKRSQLGVITEHCQTSENSSASLRETADNQPESVRTPCAKRSNAHGGLAHLKAARLSSSGK